MKSHPAPTKSRNFEEDLDPTDQIAELERRTAATEAEKRRKRLAREERQFRKAVSEKRQRQERWVAPVLLLLTLLISYVLWKMVGSS